MSTRGSTTTSEPSGKSIESRVTVIESPGKTVRVFLDARQRTGFSFSSFGSHKRSVALEYEMISLPLMMIYFLDGRRAMSLSSRKGSPAIMSPISFLVTKASRLKT